MRIEFYVSKTNRDILKNMAHTIGESVVHDDFINILGNPTNGNTGRLTFDIIPDPIPTVNELRSRELKRKLEADTITERELREFLNLFLLRDIR